MDRRSWPWKRKSSDKTEKAAAAAAAADSGDANLPTGGSSQVDKDKYRKPNIVQISVESYKHLTGLEAQVKTCEEQVQTYEEQVQTLNDLIKELKEELSAAHSEVTTKDNLVKQHSKVAEEAVSGWEKAEAEALALKDHLESVTLSKLTAEDRASHLDGALKECMRQIRNLKEEHEQKLQDVIITRTMQWDKIKLELEAKIVNLDQELLRSAAENSALSRSLQDRSNMVIKISEEKSQAEADIELLKSNIESCEREINSLKYELHIISKELEIRNEEKNMSIRSADVANKQHIEGVKKIAKLEAECQRLRGLVRKKLPGPAALAQMKLEVENLGRDYGDSRFRRSPIKPTSPCSSSSSEFSLDSTQKFRRENEFLTERFLAMEEETKMLKEALAKRNSELQASRTLCAKTASRLQSFEEQLQSSNHQKNSPKSIVQVHTEGYSSQDASKPPSLTSVSEDGNDEVQSCTDYSATTFISELSQIKKEKDIEKLNKAETAKHLELMDDFLEMEKLACLNATGGITISNSSSKSSETVITGASGEVSSAKDPQSESLCDLCPSVNRTSSNVNLTTMGSGSDADLPSVINLQSRISMIFKSVSKDADMGKILEEIKRVMQDANDAPRRHSVTGVSDESRSSHTICNGQSVPEDARLTGEKEITSSEDGKVVTVTGHILSQELAAAISQIHEFVLCLGKEAMALRDSSSDGNGLDHKIEEFSATFNKLLFGKTSLVDFLLDLSHVLAESSGLRFNVLGYKGSEAEINSPDCIDKVALPENKTLGNDSSGESYANGSGLISSATSNPEVPDDGNLVPRYGTNITPCKVSLEEFEELKSEKENMAMDLARLAENLETTTSQLHETEQLLAEVKSELATTQRSNSLAETQLKCMAESYRSLETRAQELETQMNILQSKTETLESQLQEEKKSHKDALTRCKEFQEQLQKNKGCSVCFSSADIDSKAKQEKELSAAAEKLAECQETIFLLDKQLKSLRPQTKMVTGSPYGERSESGEGIAEHEPTTSGVNTHDFDQAEKMDNLQSAGAESPVEFYSHNTGSPSDTEGSLLRSPVSAKPPKHRSTKSTSSSSSPIATSEKHSRGLSRFFSSKGKNGY